MEAKPGLCGRTAEWEVALDGWPCAAHLAAARNRSNCTALDATLAQAYETSVERLDDQFVSQAQQLDYLLVARIDHFEAILASNASRAAARVEQSLAGTMRTRRASLATGNAMLEAQLNHQIAFFNTQSTRLTANVEEQTANLSVEFQQLDSQFATPAAAFSANLRAAATAFSSDFSNALNSAPTVFQNATGALNFLFSNPTASLHSTENGLTGTGTSSTDTVDVGALPSLADEFSIAFAQNFSTINTTIQSLGSNLQQEFGSLQSQFEANVSSLTSTFNVEPFGTFAPITTYVSGIGALAFGFVNCWHDGHSGYGIDGCTRNDLSPPLNSNTCINSTVGDHTL